MRFTITFSLCFFSLYLFSQKNNSLEINTSFNRARFSKSEIAKEFKLSFRQGINYNFISEKKYNWMAGIRYADYSTKHVNDDLRWGSQHNGQGGHNGEPGGSLTSINHYYFIEMPIGVKYYLSDKKNKLFLSTSISPAMFIKKRSEIKLESGVEQNLEITEEDDGYSLRKYNFLTELAVGYLIPINKKMDALIQSTGNIQLLPAANAPNNGARLYVMGVQLGLNYKFH